MAYLFNYKSLCIAASHLTTGPDKAEIDKTVPTVLDSSRLRLAMGTGHYFWAIFYFTSLCSASL